MIVFLRVIKFFVKTWALYKQNFNSCLIFTERQLMAKNTLQYLTSLTSVKFQRADDSQCRNFIHRSFPRPVRFKIIRCTSRCCQYAEAAVFTPLTTPVCRLRLISLGKTKCRRSTAGGVVAVLVWWWDWWLANTPWATWTYHVQYTLHCTCVRRSSFICVIISHCCSCSSQQYRYLLISWPFKCVSSRHITCSTVVLQCYRRQAIPMEQGKIRPSVTL